jgi:hypothetical protein
MAAVVVVSAAFFGSFINAGKARKWAALYFLSTAEPVQRGEPIK